MHFQLFPISFTTTTCSCESAGDSFNSSVNKSAIIFAFSSQECELCRRHKNLLKQINQINPRVACRELQESSRRLHESCCDSTSSSSWWLFTSFLMEPFGFCEGCQFVCLRLPPRVTSQWCVVSHRVFYRTSRTKVRPERKEMKRRHHRRRRTSRRG